MWQQTRRSTAQAEEPTLTTPEAKRSVIDREIRANENEHLLDFARVGSVGLRMVQLQNLCRCVQRFETQLHEDQESSRFRAYELGEHPELGVSQSSFLLFRETRHATPLSSRLRA